MKFDNLAILLTCHSLEDFPVHHDGEEAESLLSNWTALWHPQLIADAGKIPTWIRTYEVPENCQNQLFLCPITSDSELQTGFAQRVKEEQGRLIRRKTCRDEIIDLIFEGSDPPTIDQELVSDFFALGYCFLQIQLLTRQLRYSSNLDEVFFASLVVDAAQAAVAGNQELVQEKLQAAFDLLTEERDNYYPVNALLIDLNLVADTTLDEKLAEQLKNPSIPSNYLITGSTCRKLAESDELKSLLLQALESEKVQLVGGSQDESRFPLLSLESVLEEFRAGKQSYHETLQTQVDFFGRRRYGLSTSLPQVLDYFKFSGGFHFTLDDGRFPEGMQIKSCWEGDGDARIEVFGKVPLDAGSPGNFLNLGVKIGESFDMDHAAAICFVHWPGQSSVWYNDLQRISKFGNVLGYFVLAKEFLEEMDEPYQMDRFTPDQYQSPYLKQAVIRRQSNPISRSVNYWKRTLVFDSIQSLRFLTSLFDSKLLGSPETIDRLELVKDFEASAGENKNLDAELETQEQQAAKAFVAALCNTDTNEITVAEGQGNPTDESQTGAAKHVVLNPASLVCRTSLSLPIPFETAAEKPVYAASDLADQEYLSTTRTPNLDIGSGSSPTGTTGQRTHIVVDVPSMGYAVLDPKHQPAAKPKSARQKPQPIVDEFALRNEFMEIVLDRTTGGVRAVHDYQSRSNRLSQVLAYRAPESADQGRFGYSQMRLEEMETVCNTTTIGQIRTTGSLMLGGQKVANYVQLFTLSKGSRVLEVDVKWLNLEAPRSDPWNWYFCSRFAYGDESSNLETTLNQTRQPVMGNRIEAPHYIDIETLKTRTSILTGGVPFHAKRGDRYLDSIHIVKDESERQFRYAIGVDLPNPLYHANALLKKPVVVPSSQSPANHSSWLFHLDSKNVMATGWETITAEKQDPGPERQDAGGEQQNPPPAPVGIKVRLLETMGRSTKCLLSGFREFTSARQIRFDGEVVSEVSVENGKLALRLAPNQFIEVEARW